MLWPSLRPPILSVLMDPFHGCVGSTSPLPWPICNGFGIWSTWWILLKLRLLCRVPLWSIPIIRCLMCWTRRQVMTRCTLYHMGARSIFNETCHSQCPYTCHRLQMAWHKLHEAAATSEAISWWRLRCRGSSRDETPTYCRFQQWALSHGWTCCVFGWSWWCADVVFQIVAIVWIWTRDSAATHHHCELCASLSDCAPLHAALSRHLCERKGATQWPCAWAVRKFLANNFPRCVSLWTWSSPVLYGWHEWPPWWACHRCGWVPWWLTGKWSWAWIPQLDVDSSSLCS